MAPDGRGALGGRGGTPGTEGDFFDIDCAGELVLNDGVSQPTIPAYNWLDMGSETITQMGWYLVTLSTEYELLGRKGQYSEQKKTLEDIFLALQAIRRLDMQAQCLLKEMYDERQTWGGYVCSEPYTNNCQRHFDTNVDYDCNYTPDFSGYNGFFLREDATQALRVLSDPSEEMYQIGAVGSAYAVSTNEIKGCPDIDRFCYNVHKQNFPSHDQVIQLLYGLCFVKRYIPESAMVTTCSGETFNVLSIAQKITAGIVIPVVHDPGRNVTVPGSRLCCGHVIKLSDCEGGDWSPTISGMILAYEYITDDNIKNDLPHRLYFEALANWPTDDRKFFIKLSAMGKELSSISNISQGNFVDLIEHFNMQIYLLGNDLLYPDGESMADKIGGKDFFEKLLCSAPCSGPCSKSPDFGTFGAYGGSNPDFGCPNTPEWLGGRWDGNSDNSEEPDHTARQFNGLDFMALYNMYALSYVPGQPYYNPESPEYNQSSTLNNHAIGEDHIIGPSNLCIGQFGTYDILPHFTEPEELSTFSAIKWISSDNIKVLDPNAKKTDAQLNASGDNSYVEASFDESHLIFQHYNGNTAHNPPMLDWTYDYIDKCAFTYRKPIYDDIPTYQISTTFKFCQGLQTIEAIGPDVAGNVYDWKITDPISQTSISASGKVANIQVAHSVDHAYINITLTVSGECGTKVYFLSYTQLPNACQTPLGGNGDELVASPNPGKDDIKIQINNPAYITPTSGLPIRFVRSDTGIVAKTHTMYGSVSGVNVSQLANGTYILQADTGSFGVMQGKLIIFRE